LPIPNDTNTMGGERNYTSPRTVVEKKVSDIAAKLLGLEQVGVGDNFLLIGGHSLFCTQLTARIRETFGVDLPLRSVFESPTSAQLAQQIETVLATKIGAMGADEVQHALIQAHSVGGQE
jgi:acyl carrier protein